MKGGEHMDKRSREQEVDSFVCREIYICQSALIEEVLKQQIFSIDEIDNLYRPFDGKLISPALCVRCKLECSFLDSETGLCEGCFEDTREPQEIFEWWLVSPWLGRKLHMAGEPLIDNGYGVWWGRCVTGQAISIDYVINQIYDEVMGG